MADKSPRNVTFSNKVINNTNEKDKISITGKLEKKSVSHNAEKKPRKSNEENSVPKAAPAVRKSTRASNKPEREPLKVVNAPAKTRASPAVKKKNSVGFTTKNSAKADSIPFQAEQMKRVNQRVPKIIVHKDGTNKAGKHETKKTRASVLSKSWYGSNPSDQKNVSSVHKKPKLSAGSKKARHSMSDLSSIRTPVEIKTLKTLTEDKSPAKQKPRFSQSKPGELEFEEMTAKLETVFPNVDPEFIKSIFVKHKGCLSETIEFLITKEKTEKLPTRADYVRRLETETLWNRFMDNFSIESFVKTIPDPWEYFLKAELHNCVNHAEHSFYYLKNKYKKHYIKTIELALKKNDYSLYLADKELKKKKQTKMRLTNRSKNECLTGSPNTFDIQFLHEVAFIEHERKIKCYIKKTEADKLKKVKEAEEAGALVECQSCCNSSLLQDDAVRCPANHIFCKDCVVKYVEIEMDKDNFKFKCLVKCEENFSFESLQAALSPPVMAKIVRRYQLEDNKSVDYLVCCPFCFHVTVLSAEDKVLNCPNPSCKLDSCRECQQFNHVPLTCHEMEKCNRTALEVEGEIEEQEETNFLKCIICNGEFLKREDSNQMVCRCGATICSICRQPFPECQHADSEPNAQTSHRLSFGSDYSDLFAAVEDDFEGSSTCSDDCTELQLSESLTF